jgi:hypothetical protein
MGQDRFSNKDKAFRLSTIFRCRPAEEQDRRGHYPALSSQICPSSVAIRKKGGGVIGLA